MTDPMPFLIFIIAMGLLGDRYLLTEQHRKEKDKLLEELSRATKAVISKNANDYVMTTGIDKVAIEEKPAKDPDEVPEESLSDDQFFKAIEKGNKE
jgi:hypothetical protein